MAFTRVLGPGIHTASNINSHNINSTGIITAVSFVGNGAGLTGIASTDNIITGTAATFNTYPVDINAGMDVVGVSSFQDIDVDGHTNLDNVSIAGVTTISGAAPNLLFTETDANPDWGILCSAGQMKFQDVTNTSNVLTLDSNKIQAVKNLDAMNGIDVTGNANVTGNIDVDGHTNLDNVNVAGVTTFASNAYFGDNDKIIFGSGNRFQIYDNGTSAIIDNSYGGGSILRLGSGNQVVLGSPLSNNQNLIRGVVNGPAELYHAGAKKLETYASGINVTGNTVADGLTIDGNSDLNGDLDVDGHTNLDNVSIAGVATVTGDLIVGGVLTYEDVTNIDSVGLITARNGIRLPDTKKIQLGDSQDLEFYHDGTDNYMLSSSGTTYIRHSPNGGALKLNATNIHLTNHTNNSTYFTATNGGAVNLYHNNVIRLSTSSVGVSIPQALDVDGHTNLDNVSIAGVTTTGTLRVGTGVTIETNGNSNFVGVSSLGTGATGAVYLYNPDADALSGTTNDIYGWKAKTYTSGLQVNSTLYLSRSGVHGLSLNYNNATGGTINQSVGFLNIICPGGLPIYLNAYQHVLQDPGGKKRIVINNSSDQAVHLYHNNVLKFSTTSSGVNIVGTTTSTQLAVTGVSTFSGNVLINGDLEVSSSLGYIRLTDSNSSNDDFGLRNDNGVFYIRDVTHGANRFSINSEGTLRAWNRMDFDAGIHLNTGDLRIVDTIKHKDDEDTKIRFPAADTVSVETAGSERLRIDSTGITVGAGVTVETNGQATFAGIVTAFDFQKVDGSSLGVGAGGTWSTYTAGIATSKSVGVNTSTLDDNDLVGVGNSFQGLYISNGMIVHDNTLSGNHYIGTAFNGLMAGPVNIEGTLSVDGNYVVV